MIRKKLIFKILLTLCLIFVALATAFANVDKFNDVQKNDWYSNSIEYVTDNNIMKGTSENSFSPDIYMSRAMLATVIYNQSGKPEIKENADFTDTVEGSYYSDAVNWASKNGIISGYSDGSFGVNDSVTHEQFISILWRNEGSPNTNAVADFTDSNDISSYALSAVAWAKENGIINGNSENKFEAQSGTTRAEAADILANYYKNKLTNNIEEQTEDKNNNVLVVYFSATGNTKSIAESIQNVLNADIYEIVPQQSYTSEDLDYNNSNSRANKEQNDSNARPAISGSIDNMDKYNTVFLGYPIWHGQAPKIISTFLESYNFEGKTIIPFCTSGSSPIGSSATNISYIVPNANWLEGRRFGMSDVSDIEEWVNSLNLTKQQAAIDNLLYIDVNGRTITAQLEENSSAIALRDMLLKEPITIDMSDYANMEKVGLIGKNLPTNDEQLNTTAGDIILYQGNKFVIYYDTNSWNFTKLGRINNLEPSELSNILGSGDVQVKLYVK